VESWAEKSKGHRPERYKKIRNLKEEYNQENDPYFIGIAFCDCYSDDRRTPILAPHMGYILPYKSMLSLEKS
jgi:hypothetical protein